MMENDEERTKVEQIAVAQHTPAVISTAIDDEQIIKAHGGVPSARPRRRACGFYTCCVP